MRANRNRSKLGVIEEIVIILNSDTAAVFFNSGTGFFRNNVAELLDLCILVTHIRRYMRRCGYIAAANNGNLDFFTHFITIPFR